LAGCLWPSEKPSTRRLEAAPAITTGETGKTGGSGHPYLQITSFAHRTYIDEGNAGAQTP